MPQRKPFLLRIDPAILESLQKWADDELRSLNGQIEWILRRALTDRKRMKPPSDPQSNDPEPPPTTTPPQEPQ